MSVPYHQNAWESHNLISANKSLENVVKFWYFGTMELIKITFMNKLRVGYIEECLPPFNPELYVLFISSQEI